MEKYGVVKEGITPEMPAEQEKPAQDCVKTAIVDNNRDKTAALDDDFRKRAAQAAAAKLTNN